MPMRPEIYYDRSVAPDCLELFLPGGDLHELVRIARKGHLVDLQFRSYPHSTSSRATLYCGLTKFLDIDKRGEHYRLSANRTFMDRAPGIRWTEVLDLDEVLVQRSELFQYIDTQVREVAERFTREGAVQSMLCLHAGELFSVVDREAVVGFRNEPTRTEHYAKVRESLEVPLRRAIGHEPWATAIPKFGGELDILAVGHGGGLLVIEVKPGTTRKGITWAGLQAKFYAGLFRAWIDYVGDDDAKDTVDRMLRQRIEIGLADEPRRELEKPIRITPIVAIGGRPDELGLERLVIVREALSDVGDGDLEIWKVKPSVTRERIP